jgi:hypothetical protein
MIRTGALPHDVLVVVPPKTAASHCRALRGHEASRWWRLTAAEQPRRGQERLAAGLIELYLKETR